MERGTLRRESRSWQRQGSLSLSRSFSPRQWALTLILLPPHESDRLKHPVLVKVCMRVLWVCKRVSGQAWRVRPVEHLCLLPLPPHFSLLIFLSLPLYPLSPSASPSLHERIASHILRARPTIPPAPRRPTTHPEPPVSHSPPLIVCSDAHPHFHMGRGWARGT